MSNNRNVGYESELLFGDQSMYGIYQLKDNEITREFAFEGTAFLERKGIEISKDKYELVYVTLDEYNARLSKNATLEGIYNKFNYARPEDFTGHSLSVSDIVVMNNGGVVTSHFVDRFGFKDVPDFTKGVNKYYDPEYDRFVTEDVIKKQYEWFESQPWFEKSYEQFKAENFTEIANTELSYYVIADIFTWKNASPDRSELIRFEDLSKAMDAFSSMRQNIKSDDEEFHTTFGMKVNDVEFDLVYTKGDDTVLSLDFSHNENVAKNKDFQEILKNICVDLEIGKVRIHREMSPEEVKNFTKQRFKTYLENTNCDDIDSYMNNFDRIYEKGNILDRYMPSISQRNIVEDISFVDWNMDNPYFELEEPDEIAFSTDDGKFVGIQRCDDGYDYSVYDGDYQLIDGGVYDNPDISIQSVQHIIMDEYLPSEKVLENVDFEELSEMAEKVEQAKIQNMYIVNDFRTKTEEMFHRINGQTAHDIEDTVWAHIQSKVDEYEIDVKIVDVIVSGSRCRGLEHEDSDLDVVVEYTGKEHEDDLFNVFNKDGLKIGDVKVEINPITEGKTGTLAEYLPGVEKYLSEKVQNMDINIEVKPRRKGR